MKNLNKEININKKIIVLMILFTIITIGLYTSYALFEISVIQNNVVVIKTGTVDITTSITDLDTPTFTLTKGETKTITVNLTTSVTNDIGYKMYYDVTSGISLFNVTSTTDYTSTNNKVEGELNTSKTITFTFQNTGNEDLTITLGTQGGLKGYPIPLEQGNELKVNEELGVPVKNAIITSVNNPTNTSCKTYVEEDGIIYISGTKDCINFNYVWYSGKLWRITAIYPDGTMKMITDGVITTINWGSKSTVSSSDLTSAYSTSYMREWLNQEFLPTLYNYENIIVEDAGWYSITDSASTPTKPTGEYTLIDPVGLLNAYEYYMSYKNTSYTNGYLNIGYYWWLITPYSSSNVRSVNKSGLYYDNSSSLSGVVRPSINLKSTIQLFGGSGTSEDPYRIKGDIEEATANITLLNTRYSGEYIKLSSDETAPIFRIVDTELVGESLTTKIVLNDYVKESDTILTKNFSSSKSYELWTEVSASDTTYWRGYLNTTWLGTLDTSMLEKGTYYLGYYTTGSYKTTVCSTVSSDVSVKKCIENGTIVSNISSDDYVGLLRAGEMFAGQTRDYTHSNAIDIWLITPYSSSNVRGVSSSGSLFSNYSASNGFGVRPSINLKSTILIKSGSGTKQDPFVVGLASAE
ncbi:MAG: hypothetical protein IJ501_00630 [Bacilli bacterium]|nr:hypothetical protein [Bacilli bacterium]